MTPTRSVCSGRRASCGDNGEEPPNGNALGSRTSHDNHMKKHGMSRTLRT